MAIICLEEDRHGNGRHLWDITGNQYTAYAKVELSHALSPNCLVFNTWKNLHLALPDFILCLARDISIPVLTQETAQLRVRCYI